MNKRRGQSLERTRHYSLEMPDPEVVVKDKKKQDMLTKARNKFFDAIKARNEGDKKSRTQATIDYFFKPCPNKNDKHQIYSNSRIQNGHNGHTRATSLQKQHSVDSYPIKIDCPEDDDEIVGISRHRPATVCVDKVRDDLGTAEALALERPRKRISFREPDLEGYVVQVPHDIFQKKPVRKAFTPEMKRNGNRDFGTMKKAPSIDLDDPELKSQAMRIVRTVGQAFEVCHKMSITAPEHEQLDYDEQETCTQDDRLSDITSDKPKRDLISEGASDKASLTDDHIKDLNGMDNNRPYQLDLLSVPSHNNNGGGSGNTSGNTSATNTLGNNNSNNNSSGNLFQRKSPMGGDNYTTHMNETALGGTGGGSLSSSAPASGNSALSAHHEIQLLREQLEQQSQQTQAAMAQLQLAREQLAAEQSARMEAQTRTHQLLVHNRELLDHIAALVAHLQGGEKASNQQQNSPHVAMPQQQQYQGLNSEKYSPEHQEQQPPLDHAMLQALGLNPTDLIENPMVTSRLPSSPLRTNFNPQSSLFNYSLPQVDFALETQLLQRLQTLCGYTPPQYSYMNHNLPPFMPNLYGQGMVNNNYTLQPPPQKRLPPSPLAVRHSYSTSPIMDNRISPTKNDSLQNIQQAYQSQQSLNSGYQQQGYQNQNYQNQNYQSNQSLNQIPQQNSQHLQVQSGNQQRQSPQRNLSPKNENRASSEPQYIKPLSQMGTLTTTDPDGRVRVIVPVPSADEATNMMSQMRLGDEFRSNVPTITRSTSEKVPNRSELMSQVQRTAWARHTTK